MKKNPFQHIDLRVNDLEAAWAFYSKLLPAIGFEGFRWPVAVSGTIAAPAEKLWEVVSLPGNLELCHPFCAKNPVHAWPGETSRDEVHYLSGWVFERRFCRWIDGVGYDLEIGRRGGRTSFVSWRIVSNSHTESTLRIAVYPHVLQQMPVAIRWIPHILRLRPMLGEYLCSVVRGFEWYVTRGEAVPRNQFGSHPWFSGPRDVPDGSSDKREPSHARTPDKPQ